MGMAQGGTAHHQASETLGSIPPDGYLLLPSQEPQTPAGSFIAHLTSTDS